MDVSLQRKSLKICIPTCSPCLFFIWCNNSCFLFFHSTYLHCLNIFMTSMYCFCNKKKNATQAFILKNWKQILNKWDSAAFVFRVVGRARLFHPKVVWMSGPEDNDTELVEQVSNRKVLVGWPLGSATELTLDSCKQVRRFRGSGLAVCPNLNKAALMCFPGDG